jgi:hypothetical protein
MSIPANFDFCPRCGRAINAVTDPLGREKRPKAGDLSICWGCAALLQFDSALLLSLADESALSDREREDVSILRENMRIVKGREDR